MECDKPQWTICNGPKATLIIFYGSYKSIFLRPKRLLKKQIIEKNSTFPVKNMLPPFFSRFVECDKPQKTIFKGPKRNLTLTMEVIRAIFQDLRGC